PKTKHKVDFDSVEKFRTLHPQEQKYFDDMVQKCKVDGSEIKQVKDPLPEGFFEKDDAHTKRDVVGSEVKQVKGALPEGFFDNKDADQRARGIEPVKIDINEVLLLILESPACVSDVSLPSLMGLEAKLWDLLLKFVDRTRKRICPSYPKDVYTRGCDGVVNDKHRVRMLKGLQSHAKDRGLWDLLLKFVDRTRKRICPSYPKDVYTRGCDGVVNDKHRVRMLKGLQSHAKGNDNILCNDEKEYYSVTFSPQPVSSDDIEVSEGSQRRSTGLNNSRNGINDGDIF
ncbi:hypothetical protein IFM89_029079, partial [Coptis chinensis]